LRGERRAKEAGEVKMDVRMFTFSYLTPFRYFSAI
jgi:hypothetical protein